MSYPIPTTVGLLGQYILSRTVNIVADQAAGGTLFSFRWGAASLCTIQRLRMSFQQTSATTAAAQYGQGFFANVARSFTASDSGGTSILPTTNNQKKRTAFATTALTDARISTASTGLTVGTRTLDASAFLELYCHIVAAAPTATPYGVFTTEVDWRNDSYPLTFAQNEGFVVTGPGQVYGSSGTGQLTVEVEWEEIGTSLG